MRLWLKLVLMAGLAFGAQWCLERSAAAIDDAVFALQYRDRTPEGAGRFDAEAMGAADELRARQAERYLATAH